MANATDDADPIPAGNVNDEYDASGETDRTISFLCAGSFIIFVLVCACYARRLNRNRPILATDEVAALTRSEVFSIFFSKKLMLWN